MGRKIIFLFLLILINVSAWSQSNKSFVTENYYKIDTVIKMRDGIKLYTVIYTPKRAGNYPILLERTPYSAGPYGNDNYRNTLGPNDSLMKDGYIFVMQDVRGRYMSEGENDEMTPVIKPKNKKTDTDESSDCYDTVDWLVENLNTNGNVGVYGISYPGFYATNALIDAHPAVKAVSPQAPVSDEFIGDDANHNGAFFLMDNFLFMNYFGMNRKGPTMDYGQLLFNTNFKDAYDFFLKMGPISNTQSPKYFDGRSKIWTEYLSHDTYNAYWQKRNIRQYLNNIKIPTLVVGGWFDAENLFGSLETYKALENGEEKNNSFLVMGPWTHGAWASDNWKSFASHDFGNNTSDFFQKKLETVFFNFYLKNSGVNTIAEANIFETGSNIWRTYDSWPPKETTQQVYYLNQGKLSKISSPATSLEYISDPAKPVPYTNGIYARRNNNYMSEDQRFASNRPDVLVYESEILDKDLIVSGAIVADLTVSISSTDADFIVKVIDVLPEDEPNFKNAPLGFQMAGAERLVRADVMRGKFRNSFSTPEPFIPNMKTRVNIKLNDIAHNFKKGHKLMIQIQSTWFPLVDRNPQKFLTIPLAKEDDFKKATIRIYGDSKILIPVNN